MCIICVKPAGVALPDKETRENMWYGNPDGAGLMWALDGKVHIEKGFMDLEDIELRLKTLSKTTDLEEIPMVFHYRITTHGGTVPANCHPFPISKNVDMLKKLVLKTDVGVAHNGIIRSVTPSGGISDTMEYISTQLSYIKAIKPCFFKDKNCLRLIENAIDSKMAFLTNTGELSTIGKFIEHDGCLYSNSSYKSWAGYKMWDYGSYIDDYDMDSIRVMEIDPKKGYVAHPITEVAIDGDFYLDKNNLLYEYDWDMDWLIPRPELIARTYKGNKYKYSTKNKDLMQTLFVQDDLSYEWDSWEL